MAGLVRKVETAKEGTRNDTLYWALCRVAELDAADRDAAIDALLHAAGWAGLSASEAERSRVRTRRCPVTRTPTPDEAQRAAAEAGGQSEPEPELRVIPVSQIKVKATEWLWHHRIPLGALTLLPGREGTGKSTAGAWLAARITKGELPGVYEGVPKGVFYAAREDDWERTIAPRTPAGA